MPNPSPADDSATLDQFSALAQRQAVVSRNLVNADELNAWLQNLLASRFGSSADNANPPQPSSRQASCERWTLSVARKWMTRQGQIESHQPSGEALAQSPAWVQQAIANGTPPQRLSLAPSERETLAGALDWMRSDDGPALSSDWSRISVDQAISSEKNWIDAMAKATLKKDLEAADAAGTTLFADSPAPGPDGQIGWRWVQVHSPEALDREGALMRHCVGSYAKDVAAERSSIYSLRDHDNKPRLTVETWEGQIAQIKSFANQACPPELFPRVAEFARSFESLCETKQWTLQVSSEVETAGVFIFPELGLCTPDALPTETFLTRFANELSEKNAASLATLPLLAALGWTDLLQLALPHASVELQTQALFKAAELGQLPSVQILVSHSDANDNGNESHFLSSAATTQAMRHAARNGHLAIVELLLPRSNPKADESQALRLAAEAGHFEVVDLLLPVSDAKCNGSSALRLAAKNGHLSVVQLLLPHSDPTYHHSLALSEAAFYGHQPVVELLLPHSDPQANGSQALLFAAEQGHLSIVQVLLPHSDPKANESFALRSAARNGHLAVVQLLLPHSDPKAKNSAALSMAVFAGRLPIIEFLLPYSDPKANNSAALSIAAQNGHLSLVQLLLPYSDPKAESSSALIFAASINHRAIVELLLPHSEFNGQCRALQRAKDFGFSEISELIQAAIDAQAHPQAPELASVGQKLLHERQRQSQPLLTPTQTALNPATIRP